MPKLSARWQLDAALLSRPVDLTALVSLSQSDPEAFFSDDTLGRMVKIVLNASDEKRSDKETRLDVLTVLSNLAGRVSSEKKHVIRMALDGINDFFDTYLEKEESRESTTELVEPELHKLMLLLLCRLYDYKLKTEHLLELVRGDKVLGLETVVGLLEDGETYSTELQRKQAPNGNGQMGQWEHKLISNRHEKPLVLQLCRLVRGFTLPSSYFVDSDGKEDISEFAVNEFTSQMNLLLDITLKSRLVEKISLSCYACLFLDENNENFMSSSLEDTDHRSIACVHSFLQNLYLYATHRNDEYRQHLLAETPLVPRLILPYLDHSIKRAQALSDQQQDSTISEAARRKLECPPLLAGISASLRTLVIASFRAPSTRFMLELLRRLNPTESLLNASVILKHEYIFALLCLLNANMGAVATSSPEKNSITVTTLECHNTKKAHTLLHALAAVYRQLSSSAQARVLHCVYNSGALPVSRDTPAFAAVVSVLLGGSADGQSRYGASSLKDYNPENSPCSDGFEESEFHISSRAQAKQAAEERMAAKISAVDHKNHDQDFRLLGNLPSLEKDKNRKRSSQSDPVYMHLALPRPESPSQKVSQRTDSFPPEFACAINGHILKEPLRSPYGHVFEKSTILLWLSTRGMVCPLTTKPLSASDLTEDSELRSRLLQWHIARMQSTMRTSISAMHGDEDDLYDF